MVRPYDVRKLVASGVFIAAMASLVLVGGIFLRLAATGQTQLTIAFGRFGEFWLEFCIFVGATVFLPVLLYEMTEMIEQQNA
jgi:hypothetical protein